MRATAVLALVTFLLTTGPVMAQPAPAAADAWRALAAAIEPGAFVSVRTKDGTRVRGTLVQQVDGGIVMKPKTRLPSPLRTVAYTDIEEIERAKPGMTAGVKVALGAGIAAGALLLVSAILVALIAD